MLRAESWDSQTLCQLLLSRARKYGDRTFLFWQDETISYQQMADRADRAAAALVEAGVQPGDRVAIMMANCPEFLYAWFGAMRASAVAVPINPALTAEEAGFIVSNSEARVLVVDAGRAALVPQLPAVSKVFETTVDGSGALPPVPEDLQAYAALIYTSGTTGRPKGVILTHRNYMFDSDAALKSISLDETSRFLCILPLFHVNAQVVTTLLPLLVGGQMVLLSRFVPQTFLSDVSRYRATAFSAVPTIYAMLLAQPEAPELDLSSLQHAICGAAPMPVEVFERIEARFKMRILEGYGLSEATCVSSMNPAEGVRKIGSIGLPIHGQAMRIVNDAGEPLPDGEIGEIAVQGENVMVGYFGNPQATSDAIRNGWLHTGDLGVRDNDGYFTIVGRKKDMIIRGGENIYPKEVEEVLHRHPTVQEASVIGLPDEVWGEKVCAVVVLRPSAVGDEEALMAWCRDHLAGFKCPRQVVFVEPAAVPRTPTGKVQKNRLRESLLVRHEN